MFCYSERKIQGQPVGQKNVKRHREKQVEEEVVGCRKDKKVGKKKGVCAI